MGHRHRPNDEVKELSQQIGSKVNEFTAKGSMESGGRTGRGVSCCRGKETDTHPLGLSRPLDCYTLNGKIA